MIYPRECMYYGEVKILKFYKFAYRHIKAPTYVDIRDLGKSVTDLEKDAKVVDPNSTCP